MNFLKTEKSIPILRISWLAIVLAFSGGIANAQTDMEASDSDAAEDDQIEEITVTGSRLKRSTFTSVSPLQIVDGETARDLGLVNAQDILTNTTVISGQQNTVGLTTVFQGTLAQAFSTIGSSTPSLRGLGSSVTGRSRSLILIDGRRLGPIGVGGAPANPDVSMIPGSLIERTEILLDGASSVYGSDAVGGVVNYIMRKEFDGVELSAQTSQSQHGWGLNKVISLATGFDSDRGYVSFAAEMSEQDEITTGDIYRDFWGPTQGQLCNTTIGEYIDGSRVELCDEIAANFIVSDIGTIVTETGLEPTTPIPGAPGFYVRDGSFFRPVNDPSITSIPESLTESFLPKIKRTSVFFTGEYSVADNHDFFFEAMFANRELKNVDWNQEVLGTDEDTPFNPVGAAGLFVFPQQNDVEQEIDVARLVGGLRGDLPGIGFGEDWSYEVFVQSHRSTGFQNRGPYFHEERLAQGLSATLDPVTFEYDCSSDVGPVYFGFAQNRSPFPCVPLNLYVPSFLQIGRFATEAENDYAYGFAGVQTRVEQNIAGGYITGEFGSFPKGGPVQILFGLEGRQDKVRTTPSDNLRLGLLTALDADVGSNGERWIREAFAEFSLPILEGVPFAERLTFEGAVRYTEEEFSGDDTTYQAKLEWAPLDYLTIRGGFGTSFRAPDTGEQFGTGTVFAQVSRIDPCIVSGLFIDPLTEEYDPSLETRSDVLLDNCRSLGLDPTTLGTVNQGGTVGDLAFVSNTVEFGNFGFEKIQPETSEAWFAGLTFDQPWTDAFDLSVALTWYDYVIEGSIGQLTRSQILNDCFESVGLSDPLCAFQTRGTDGQLTAVNEASINLGETTSAGYDLNIRAGFELPKGIDVQWDVLYTHSNENTEDVLGDNNVTDLLGTLDAAGAFPNDQIVSTLNGTYGDFGLIWRMRFISRVTGTLSTSNSSFSPCFDPDLGGKSPDCEVVRYTDDYFQNDLFGVYRGEDWVVRLGINNMFDEVQKIDNAYAQSGVPISSGHDIFGRRYTLGFEKRF